MKNNRCVIQPFMLKKVLHDAKKEKRRLKEERNKRGKTHPFFTKIDSKRTSCFRVLLRRDLLPEKRAGYSEEAGHLQDAWEKKGSKKTRGLLTTEPPSSSNGPAAQKLRPESPRRSARPAPGRGA